MSDFFSPFHYLATLLVALLPADASDLAVGSAILLGIMLVLSALLLFAALLGTYLERRF